MYKYIIYIHVRAFCVLAGSACTAAMSPAGSCQQDEQQQLYAPPTAADEEAAAAAVEEEWEAEQFDP